MPLNSFLFTTAAKHEKVYVNILSFLSPQSFLEAAQLAHFFSTEDKQSKEDSIVLARSLDEIKKATRDIFTEEDTVLTAKVERIIGGLTNISFKLVTAKECFFLRIPGKGSEEHVSRMDENYNLRIAQSLGLNIRINFFNAQTGLYIGEFIKDATPMSGLLLKQKQTMVDIAMVLKKLHTSPDLLRNNCDIFTRLNDLLRKIDAYGHTLLQDRDVLNERLRLLYSICAKDESKLVACHNDTTPLNFLYKGKRLYLLDWEYASNNKALFDLANFALISKLSSECELWLLHAYYDNLPSQDQKQCFEAYKQLTCLWYYLWAELQLANNSNVNSKSELIDLANEYWDKLPIKSADFIQYNI